MSGILNYSQPDFYHFAEDSIQLADFAATAYQKNGEISIADLFAGCGVVGLEFVERRQDVKECDFYEIIPEYGASLEKNLTLSTKFNCDFHCYWGDLFHSLPRLEKKYSVILANPPFYDLSAYRPPIRGGAERVRCRMWTREEQIQLAQIVALALGEDGRAYILAREHRLFQQVIESNRHLKILSVNSLGKSSIFEIGLNVERD